jgi:DNA-binding MarR family transcriptional regulator/GNAT superfamily N-acetyltransferase
MTLTTIMQRVEAVRRFNRFYTRQIGVLERAYLGSPFSVTEARVIYDLANHEQITASELCGQLGLDAGYLSRILRDFQKHGLIEKQTCKTDGRQSLLQLTEKGEEAFAVLNSRSHNGIEAMLNKISAEEQNNLVEAMRSIERLLGAPGEENIAYVLRAQQPGDMGWVVQRHAVLYTQEYGWDEQFEALVAEIVAKFIRHYDPKCERCWIAEMDGENVGSVFLVKESDTVAKLRLLLVEPKVRGLGIGRRLVEECVRFAHQAGYKKMTLWTNSILLAARNIYEKSGFVLVNEEAHHSFGHDLIGETWEMDL